MSQISLQDDFSFGRHGKTAKVVGSGNNTMSDSSMGLYPVIDEPSKGWPFSKILSMFFEATARFFMIPFMSVNCSLTNFMSFSCISWMTLVTFFFQTASLKFFNFYHSS